MVTTNMHTGYCPRGTTVAIPTLVWRLRGEVMGLPGRNTIDVLYKINIMNICHDKHQNLHIWLYNQQGNWEIKNCEVWRFESAYLYIATYTLAFCLATHYQKLDISDPTKC